MGLKKKGFDQASHYPIAVPLWSTETAEVWKAFEDHWIGTLGVPTLLFFGPRITIHIHLLVRVMPTLVIQ